MSTSEPNIKSEISTVFGRCRCCLEYGYMKNMWGEYFAAGEREIYGEMLMETFSIAWDTSTDHKAYICELCVVRLRDSYNFKKEVLASEQILQDDSDNELQIDDEGNWYKFEEDAPTPEPELYEQVEYLDEYAPALEGTSKKSEEDAPGPAAKPGWTRRKKRQEGAKPYKNYTALDMRMALEAVRSGDMSIAEAAKRHGVPRKTVTAKLHSIKNQPLGEDEEAVRRKAIEALNVKKYKYLGGDEVHKHKANVQNILECSNATPIKGHSKNGFSCYFCKQNFKIAKELKEHTVSVHKLDLGRLHSKHTLQWTIRLDVTDLQCSICCLNLTKLEELIEHLESHNRNVYTDVKNQLIPFSFPRNKFKCMVCDKNFKWFKVFVDHMIEHYKIYECGECGKGFISKKNLSRHVSRHRVGDFKCSYCDKEFANRELSMTHERLVHKSSDRRRERDPSEALECYICQMKLPTVLQLSRHIKKYHLKEKRFHCEHCDKGFFVKSEMVDHMVIHGGKKDFKCSLCDKAYARRRGLIEHLRVHAKVHRHRCQLCPATFLRAQTLRQHERETHGNMD